MPKKLVKQITEEVLQEPARVVKEAVKQIRMESEEGEQLKEEKLSQEEIAKRSTKAKRILAAHRAELRDIKELPKQITGKPEFSEEKLARRLEKKEKKKKEPAPLVAAKPKMGTRERIKGILG